MFSPKIDLFFILDTLLLLRTMATVQLGSVLGGQGEGLSRSASSRLLHTALSFLLGSYMPPPPVHRRPLSLLLPP